MRGSDSIILYIVCFKLILHSTETIGSFRPGHRLNATAFRNISGLDIAACKFECQSRRKCESYNYYRHVKLCSLLGSNSSSAETVRDPKVTYGEKQTWTEQSVDSECNSLCNDTQTCRIEGNPPSCRTEECGSPYELGDLSNQRGNMRNVGGKIVFELACYDIVSEGTYNHSVSSICKEGGKWLAPNITCFHNMTDIVVHEGCYVDNETRVLSGPELSTSNMTIPFCAKYCFKMGYEYFGLEYRHFCFCGSDFTNLGQSNACFGSCVGDNTTVCGGTWAINIYTFKEAFHDAFQDAFHDAN